MVDLTGMTLAVEKSKNGLAEEHTSASPMQPSPGSLHQDNLVGIQQDQNNGSAESGKPISFYFAFLSLSMGVLLVSLDVTALPVAVARITNDLNGTTLEAWWTNLAYVLAIVITQPIYTTISDVFGRKIPLYAAFLLFFLGSIVFATANNMPTLIVGRIIQGLGGGGLDVLGEVILADITTLKERPLYLGLFSVPLAGGGICGPIIGAAFSEYATWRWIGWLNLPLIAIGFGLSFFFLHQRPIDRSFKAKLRRLDWIGMLLFTVGSTTLALPLSWAGVMYPWSSWRTIVSLVFGTLLLIAFAINERRPEEPMFPYRIFQNTTAAVTLVGATLHGLILYSMLLYAPLFFQAVRLETPFRSAISILPAGCSIVGFSVISAVFVEVVHAYRWLIIFNWILATGGVGLWALWCSSSTPALLYGLQVLAGVGVGTLFTVLTIPMQASVDDVDDMGIAAGITVSFRLFGGLLGLAVGSSVFNNVLSSRIALLGHLPSEVEVLTDIREAVAFIPMLRSLHGELAITPRILEAYRTSFMAVFLALAGFGVIGFLTSLWTKELSLEKNELGRQRLEKHV